MHNVPNSNDSNNNNDLPTPTPMPTTTTTTTITTASKRIRHQHQSQKGRFWRYDDAGPKIEQARTHYLSSIPLKYRMNSSSLPSNKHEHQYNDTENTQFFDHLRDQYSSNPDNAWPKKLHLLEMNPSLAKLPEHYRNDKLWRFAFGNNSSANLPHYASVYRITHWNNCYDGTTNLNLFGGSWDNAKGKIPKIDYLGLSLMDANLNVLLDTTVDPKFISNRGKNIKISFPAYDDYRLFNLGEQLYLTSNMYISPIDLQLILPPLSSATHSSSDHQTLHETFVEIPPAFKNDANNNDYTPDTDTNINTKDIDKNNNNNNNNIEKPGGNAALKVWIRNYSSCPVGSHDTGGKSRRVAGIIHKNLLYFGSSKHNQNKNGENQSNTNTAKVLFYPRYNPNDVRHVDLEAPCNTTRRSLSEMDEQIRGPNQPVPSFETIEGIKYPNQNNEGQFFMADRGSACCVRVKKKSIPTTATANVEMANTTSDDNDNFDEELLVAIVHPKTKFPGKKLPQGVTPNTYLSRFIAFLPGEPYTIVAMSGMFCLGYPIRGMDDDIEKVGSYRNNIIHKNDVHHSSPLTFRKMSILQFANETYQCPRIHFITGMIEKVKNDPSEEDSFILSYGVSDCLSRFVEIKTSEIVRMLSGLDS